MTTDNFLYFYLILALLAVGIGLLLYVAGLQHRGDGRREQRR